MTTYSPAVHAVEQPPTRYRSSTAMAESPNTPGEQPDISRRVPQSAR